MGEESCTPCRRMRCCVVGSGAIGSHIAYSLRRATDEVYVLARGETAQTLREDGLRISVCGEPEIVERGLRVVEAEDIAAGRVPPVDYLILTVKVYSLDAELLATLKPLISPATCIVPPTTSIPFWWCHSMGGEFDGAQLEKLDPQGLLWETFPPEQCLGLTYWLSAVQEAPGVVNVKHIQRGYPVGELDGKPSARALWLAEALKNGGAPSACVDNIRSEIFIKAVNSMAFNAVAVLTGATNGQMADCEDNARSTIAAVMAELEQLAVLMELPLFQTAEERIEQTLASRAHTMSMLHDLQVGKELEAFDLFDSFEALSELTGVDLPLTRALVQLASVRKHVVQLAQEQAAEHQVLLAEQSAKL